MPPAALRLPGWKRDQAFRCQGESDDQDEPDPEPLPLSGHRLRMRKWCSSLHVRRPVPLQGIVQLRERLRLRGKEV